MTQETELMNSILEETLVKLNPEDRANARDIFQRLIQSYALKIMEGEAHRKKYALEEDIESTALSALAALAFLSSLQRVEWDQVGELQNLAAPGALQ
ncbi:MAG: hypothetical protein LKK51_07165 [Eubacterium sp.]|jgi:hypothetical protein|uniref:hypothetical protein n=1 Tax=Eubacterium sp. F2 TaxID=3381348 RepID=UPI00390809E5|nr:hypothetical protein [Eubacterium sp.]MCI2197821.1 hypothetical protein [Eubacterium sp.]